MIGHVKNIRVIISSGSIVKLDNHLHGSINDNRDCKRNLDLILNRMRGPRKGDGVVEQRQPLRAHREIYAPRHPRSRSKDILPRV